MKEFLVSLKIPEESFRVKDLEAGTIFTIREEGFKYLKLQGSNYVTLPDFYLQHPSDEVEVDEIIRKVKFI